MSDTQHPYEVRQSHFTGKHLVYYKCPHCSTDLHNPIEHAGSEDQCPECNMEFTVPGADARQWLREKQADAEKEQRAQRRAAEEERSRRASERRAAASARLQQTQATAKRAVEQRANPTPEQPCFPRYWLPSVVRVLWVLSVIGASLTIAFGAFAAISNDGLPAQTRIKGFAILVGGTLLALIWTRIALELAGVLFDILRELRRGNQLTVHRPEPVGTDG